MEPYSHSHDFVKREFFLKFSAGLVTLVGFGYAVFWHSMHQPMAMKISLINGILGCIITFYKYLGLKFKLIAHLLLLISLEFCLLSNILFYKTFPILITYFCLIPIASLLLLGRKNTMFWMLLCFIGMLFSSTYSDGFQLNFTISPLGSQVLNLFEAITVFLITAALLFLYDWNLTHYIEQLKKQNRVILQSQKQLEESQKFKDNFFNSMSHELRTPMNAIKGIAELLLQSSQNDKNHELYKSLHSSSNHLLSIINDLLDLGKMDEKKLVILNLDYELRETISVPIKLMQHAAREKSIDLTWEIDEALPKLIKGDPIRVNQILLNILNNAVKFTPQGQVTFRAKLIEKNKQKYLLFTVEDTGIGIPEEMKPHIFDRYAFSNHERIVQFGGTGLGLNIVKNLVDLMNGIVWCRSEVGKGTKFFVQLPLQMADQAIPSTQHVNIPSLFEELSDLKILIVDDNDMNRMIAKRLLENSIKNSTIYTATNGKEALELVEQQPDTSLILMDLQMPILGGSEATRLIRKNQMTSHIPIIAMTAASDANEIYESLQAGMNDYISKPFESKSLLLMIHKYAVLSIRVDREFL